MTAPRISRSGALDVQVDFGFGLLGGFRIRSTSFRLASQASAKVV
jgi:hypothetical protein